MGTCLIPELRVLLPPMAKEEAKKNSSPEPVIRFTDPKKKPLSELKASDVPSGLGSDDLIDDEIA